MAEPELHVPRHPRIGSHTCHHHSLLLIKRFLLIWSVYKITGVVVKRTMNLIRSICATLVSILCKRLSIRCHNMSFTAEFVPFSFHSSTF